MKIALLTSCSVSRSVPPLVKVQDIPEGTMAQCFDWWTHELRSVASSQNVVKAGEIYQGHAYETITEISQIIKRPNVHIVTGGVGLTKLDQAIVPYDFTSDKTADYNIHQCVKGEKFVPTWWWQAINEYRHGEGTPITALQAKNPKMIIFGALTKGFIKYIARDLEALGADVLRNQVFIPISRSSMGGFPKAIRDAFVPYEMGYTSNMSFTRYNKPHVVTLYMLRSFLKDFETDEIPFVESAQKIIDMGKKEALKRVIRGTEAPDYKGIFERYPEIAACEFVEQAIKTAKVLGISIGGKHRFMAAWRGAKGSVSELEGFDEDTEAFASNALATLIEQSTKTAKVAVVDTATEELLRHVGLFIKIVREGHPELLFSAKMIALWGKGTFGDNQVSGIQSAVKLAYILDYNQEYLCIEAVESNGKPHYRIKKAS